MYICTPMQLDTFQTLADPTRRLIVESLLRGEQPVNDIVAAVDIHQSGVSRHLRILQEAGFVQVRPEGSQRFYSLRPEPFREWAAWFSSIDACGRRASTGSRWPWTASRRHAQPNTR